MPHVFSRLLKTIGLPRQGEGDKVAARALWLKLHTYLALSVGLTLAVIGLSGSLSIYREEIDLLLNPNLTISEPKGDYQSLDTIVAAVRAAHPDRYGEWTLELPMDRAQMLTAWFEKPRETYFERYAPLMVSVNPYTAEVVASRFWGKTAATWLSDLHTQLLLGDTGWNVVGYCGIVLLISVASGLYLWWPGVRGILGVFKLRVDVGLMRLLRDGHRLVGVLAAVALVVLALTGLNLSFPSVLEKLAGTSGMAHGETGKAIASTAQPNDHPVLLEAAKFVAQSAFSGGELRRVTTPDGNTGVFRLNFRQKDEINRRHPYATVWVDRWSGQIKEVRTPAKFNAGETLITWMWPLHTGESLGKLGRFLWFLAGQGLFFLYVSGLLRWLYRKGFVRDRKFNLPTKREIEAWLVALDDQLTVLAQTAIRWVISVAWPLLQRYAGLGLRLVYKMRDFLVSMSGKTWSGE